MPSQETSKSPARRPQLHDGPSSSNSINKGSPKGVQLLNTHKGSSTRLHKTHAVGHGRPIHARVPSHGKGLNKLTKIAQGAVAEDDHRHSASLTPSTSPTNLSNKRNSSTNSLQRPPSRGSVKRNSSHPALARNGTTKLGNQQKSEKAQMKRNLLKKSTDDAPIRGTVQFEIGNDGDDDEWTEDSGSQSPATTRTHSRPKTPVTPAPLQLPTPDEPPERRSPQLPVSPPESPQLNGNEVTRNTAEIPNGVEKTKHTFSHPPDAQAVTSRLLNRSGIHNIPPQTSNISANVTPHHIGSPKFSESHHSSDTIEPSMPEDGISRFLSRQSSNSGAGTLGSISHLQQNLANFNHSSHNRAHSPTATKADARRVKSAANLTHSHLGNEEHDAVQSSPKLHRADSSDHTTGQPPLETDKHPFKPSPFESARGANPHAGKSYTQLKLNLDREASSRDPPISDHPLLNSGSVLNYTSGSISSNPRDIEKRVRNQYARARKDLGNCRKYYPDIVTGKVPERAVKRHQIMAKEKRGRKKIGQARGQVDGAGTAPGSGAGSLDAGKGGSSLSGSADGKEQRQQSHQRGRVRFELGKPSKDEREGSEERVDDVSIDALLRRMWIAPEPRDESDGS